MRHKNIQLQKLPSDHFYRAVFTSKNDTPENLRAQHRQYFLSRIHNPHSIFFQSEELLCVIASFLPQKDFTQLTHASWIFFLLRSTHYWNAPHIHMPIHSAANTLPKPPQKNAASVEVLNTETGFAVSVSETFQVDNDNDQYVCLITREKRFCELYDASIGLQVLPEKRRKKIITDDTDFFGLVREGKIGKISLDQNTPYTALALVSYVLLIEKSTGQLIFSIPHCHDTDETKKTAGKRYYFFHSLPHPLKSIAPKKSRKRAREENEEATQQCSQ